MAEKTVTQEIIELLGRDKTSGEIIGMGYRPRTVYSVQHKLQRKSGRTLEQSHRQRLSAAVADPHGRDDTQIDLSSQLLKGRIKPLLVDLDPRLTILYDWTCALVPDYEASFGEFISDCVLGYCQDHAKQLDLERLFQKGE